MGAILNILILTISLLFSLYLASAALWHIFDTRIIIAFLLIILLLAIWKEILNIKKRNNKTEKEKYDKVIDKIIAHLKLTFHAERPPPPQIVQKELLMAAEERGEYF